MMIKRYNIKEGETIEMTMLLVGGMKRDELMPSATKEPREAKRRTSKTYSDKSGFDNARLSDIKCEVQDSSKESEEKMEDMMQRMELMMTSVKDMKCDSDAKFEKITEALTQMKSEGRSKLDKMNERFKTLEARMEKLERQENERKEKAVDASEKNDRSRNVADEHRAVATGFHENTTEKDVETLLEKTIDMIGMKKDRIRIERPEKPDQTRVLGIRRQ